MMTAISKEQFVDFLKNMTVVEAGALVQELEDLFGVKAVDTNAPAPMPSNLPTPTEEAQTEFTVVLQSVPADKKIAAIKEVRAATGLGLSESKSFVEALPKPVKEGVSKQDAEKLKAVFEAVGAKVEIQ